MSKLTKESDWAEWKQECAFELCNEKAQERLGKFCSMRLFNSSKGCSPKTFLEISEQLGIGGNVDLKIKNQRVLAYLDAQFIIDKLDNKQKGKKKKILKEWMIKESPTLSHIEATATYFIWGLRKKFLKDERGAEFSNFSKGRKVGNEGLTLDDLAESNEPRPADEIKYKELEEELYAKANVFYLELSKDRKIAILARSLGISLKNSIVLAASEKGHSVLYENLKNDLAAFAGIIQKCEDLKNEPTARLEIASLHILGGISLEWAKKPENGCIEILKVSDD